MYNNKKWKLWRQADGYSPNIEELKNNGVDIVALKKIIDKINDSFYFHKYGDGECGPGQLIKIASMKSSLTLFIVAVLTIGTGLYCYWRHSYQFLSIFEQRRIKALKDALNLCINSDKDMNAQGLCVIIPRSFPAYIHIDRKGITKTSVMMNKVVLDEIEKSEYANRSD